MKLNLKPKLEYKDLKLIAFIVIAIGVLVRVVNFGKMPLGFNQDEAFAAYEAFSLINYGVDSAGNPFPTYFVSWGSGMNVLESYLSIPFMLIFGYSEVVFRLPSLICAIITLPVFWLTLKRLFNNQVAIIGLFLLSISPWHIMLSRWALESNLAPSFLLFGLYFLVKSIDKNACLLLSALFFGLSLYAYSVVWIYLPVMLLVFGIYYIVKLKGKIQIKYLISAIIILFIFALPHFLFLLINSGVIPEIKTSFFTIPKLVYMRGSEISLSNIFKLDSWKNLFNILILQNDSLKTNCTAEFGLFYHISLPFLLLGFVAACIKLKNDIKAKVFSGAYFILGGFMVYFIISLCLFNLNINKSNGMHLFTLSIIAFGIYKAVNFIKAKKIAIVTVSLAFLICFGFFVNHYFGSGGKQISEHYSMGLGDAVELVKEKGCGQIAVDRSVYHSQILFYDKTNQKVFENTVEYEVYPHPYLSATSFGKYTFIYEYNHLENFDAYIFPVSHLYFFSEEDFEITVFEKYAVAIAK